MVRTTKIISTNVDNRVGNILALEKAINLHSPIVCALQDTKTTNNEANNRILNMVALGYDITQNQDKQVTLLTKKNVIQVNKIHTPKLREGSKSSALAASISIEHGASSQKHYLIIFNIYIRPQDSYEHTRELLDWIQETARQNEGLSKTILLGDFNAAHPRWVPIDSILTIRKGAYDAVKKTRGRQIVKFCDYCKLKIMNETSQGPTLKIGEKQRAHIDLIIIGNKVARCWKKFRIYKTKKDTAHNITSLESKIPGLTIDNKVRKFTRTELSKMTNEHFESLRIGTSELRNNWRYLNRNRITDRLDTITEALYDTLLRIQQAITTTINKPIRNNRFDRANALSRRYIRRIKANEKKIKATNNVLRKKEIKAKILNNTRKLINSIKQKQYQKRFGNFAKEQENDLWDKIRISKLVEKEYKPEPKTFDIEGDIKNIDELEQLASNKFPETRSSSADITDKLNKDQYRIQIGLSEMNNALKEMRNKKYTSPEGIKTQLFYLAATNFINDVIHTIVEMSYETCHIPTAGRGTKGTIIPKKAPGQFRIVHVSNPISVLLELIALHRLEHQLELRNINSPYQFGFTANRGRHELIARIIELTTKNAFRRGKGTTIISLDIEGAFDKVDHDVLINKLDKSLKNNPIKYWIAQFCLNRIITIRYKHMSTKPRPVCQGVPQGSSLGPILWNLIINDIEKRIIIYNETEILKYADDILLVSTNTFEDEIQNTLDKLIERINALKLRTRPEKCSVMVAAPSGHRLKQGATVYTIRGDPIKQVQSLSILGIPITNRIKLDYKTVTHTDRIGAAIRELQRIKDLGIIHNQKQWSILIESYLSSKIIMSNWIMLLIDKKACIECDKTMVKALRVIFDWPANTSSKAIRAITGLRKSIHTAREMANKGKLDNTFGKVYEYLARLSHESEAKELSELPHNTLNIVAEIGNGLWSQKRDIKRVHHNPELTLRVIERNYKLSELWELVGPIWLLSHDGHKALMVQQLYEQTVQIRKGIHKHYPHSYFDKLALIWDVINDSTILCRNLALERNESLLSALKNMRNKDWRIIELRERMHKNGWRVFHVNHEERPSNVDRVCNEGIKALEHPNVEDYKRKNDLKRAICSKKTDENSENLTKIMQIICNDADAWATLPPNWYNGEAIMALTGLINDKNGELRNGTIEDTEQCDQCKTMMREHVIWHRLIECPAFRETRNEVLGEDNQNRSYSKILKDKRMHQKMIKFIKQIAFRHNQQSVAAEEEHSTRPLTSGPVLSRQR